MEIDKNWPQEQPRYYGYYEYKKGGYSKITKCGNCNNIGLYEDCHTVYCCKKCGGRVFDYGGAKWINPIYNIKITYFGFKKEIEKISDGYWSR